MSPEDEFEMATHIAAAFSHVREARTWGGEGDAMTLCRLADAEQSLRRLWKDISADNRRLVDLHAYSRAAELLHP